MTPYMCEKCEVVKWFDTFEFSKLCTCGGEMLINYEDNYEEDQDHTPCNGCLSLRVGNGEKCNYCSRI